MFPVSESFVISHLGTVVVLDIAEGDLVIGDAVELRFADGHTAQSHVRDVMEAPAYAAPGGSAGSVVLTDNLGRAEPGTVVVKLP